MNKLTALIFFLAVLIAGPLFSCVNEFDTRKIVSQNEPFGPYLQIKRYDGSYLHTRRQELEEKYKTTDSLPYLSDMAVTLIRLGDPITAKNMLLGVWDENKPVYQLAANIGTAYELIGTNDSALIWIKRAISIDPGSHKGSEWIHEMIIRYKLAKEKNAEYTTGSSALNLDFGQKDLPENVYNLNLAELKTQLGFQLTERLSFVNPPDALMGMLIFDYANIVALNDNIGDALIYYKKARDFGFESYLLDARINRMEKLAGEGITKKASEFTAEEIKEGSSVNVYLVASLIAILAVVLVYIFMRRKKAEA